MYQPRNINYWVVRGLAISSLCCVGCYHNRISRPNAWAPATEVEQRTVWSFFWGAEQQNIVPCNCHADGLSEVTVSRDLGQALITVLTFGMAAPITIEWRCSKTADEESDDF